MYLITIFLRYPEIGIVLTLYLMLCLLAAQFPMTQMDQVFPLRVGTTEV
ncbi:hypothetical protein SAMN04488689_102651 [Paenibacillus sp. cl6col]|nr:hypothetical protein SAMN04488689_102651 [Paenibacillus sp. cl6col]